MDYKINNKAIDKLKYDLVREGLLDYSQLISAIDQAQEEKTSLSEVLIQNKVIKEEVLLNFLEAKLHIPYVNLDDYIHDPDVAKLITKEEACKYKLLPLFNIEDTITIAMADPLDLFALNNISISQQYKLEPVICSEQRILSTINAIFNANYKEEKYTSPTKPAIESVNQFNWQTELNSENTDEVNMYRLVKAIIFQAINETASEIHIEPQKDEIHIRFRIDGLLYSRGSLPVLLASSFTTRLKSASALNAEEQHLPQHGRMEINLENKSINARVSTYPTNFGERIVIKIYNKAPDITRLGLNNDQISIFKQSLSKNTGIIIASGQNNQGESTTFYAALKYLGSEHKNIMTIESPIRYNIRNINQTQIDLSRKLSFELALNSILLQEPDIIYISKLKTSKEIEETVMAALSGKLILTAAVSNSATGALYSLLRAGIDPQLVASSFNAAFSQKLIRVLCPNCKKETLPERQILEKYNLPDNTPYYQQKGCKYCNNTGYKGQTAIFEIFSIENINKDLLYDKIPEPEFAYDLKKSGVKTLTDAALTKVKEGITSIEEVIRLLNV